MGIAACRSSSTVGPAIDPISCPHCDFKIIRLKQKKICSKCYTAYCIHCAQRCQRMEEFVCLKCQLTYESISNGADLINLKLRDLKWFLDTRSISISGCNETRQLEELIECYGRPHQSPMTDHSPIYIRVEPRPSQFQPPPISPVREEERVYEQSFLFSDNGPNEAVDVVIEDIQEVECSEIGSNSVINIQDIKNPLEIDNLTVRQLKLILTRNYIDYRGCCEKKDLQQRVHRLWNQKQTIEKVEDIEDENLCKLCMAESIDCVLLECGHMATCTACGKRLPECPICRQYVSRVVHIFKA